MKKQNLAAVIVFASLCTVLLGAPGEPNPALKSVVHDATLTGDGTAAAPLRVVGTNGGGRVVDSLGHLVGPLIVAPSSDVTFTAQKLGSHFSFVRTRVDGFPPDGPTSVLYHTTVDCSGPRYMQHQENLLVRESRNIGGTVFYPADPIQQLTLRSAEQFMPNSNTALPGLCMPLNPQLNFSAGIAESLDLSTLGFVPPFHLEF
jgi:hypothetical protein